MRNMLGNIIFQVLEHYDKYFIWILLFLCIYYFILNPWIIKPFYKKVLKVNLKTNDFEANFENAHPLFVLSIIIPFIVSKDFRKKIKDQLRDATKDIDKD